MTTLIVPGLNGSGEGHWQQWWKSRDPAAVWVDQDNWAEPDLAAWSDRLGRVIDAQKGPVWLVAHSFGCLASIKAAVSHADRISGLFLAAPADPLKFGLEPQLPRRPLAVPGLLLASENDPWMRVMNAAWWAERWGLRLVSLGRVGHLNIESGFGPWPQGRQLFEHMTQSFASSVQGNLESDFSLMGVPSGF